MNRCGLTGDNAMTDAELVKAESAAKAMGLHVHYLYRLASRGQVPHYRAGRALRFSIPELRTWMKHEAEGRTMGGDKDMRDAALGRLAELDEVHHDGC